MKTEDLIEVEIKGKGKEVRFQTDSPQEAIRRVARFITRNYPQSQLAKALQDRKESE